MNFGGDAREAAEKLREFFDNELDDDKQKSVQVVLSLWVLSLISLAVQSSEDEWVEWSEKLRDIGYRILEEPAENLVEELRNVQDVILTALDSKHKKEMEEKYLSAFKEN